MEKHAFELEQTLKKLVESIDNPDEVTKLLKQISEKVQDVTIKPNLSSNLHGINLSPLVVQASNSTSIFGPASIYNESLLITNEQSIKDGNLVKSPKHLLRNTV